MIRYSNAMLQLIVAIGDNAIRKRVAESYESIRSPTPYIGLQLFRHA